MKRPEPRNGPISIFAHEMSISAPDPVLMLQRLSPQLLPDGVSPDQPAPTVDVEVGAGRAPESRTHLRQTATAAMLDEL
jgi:hypothetical protein